MNVPGKWADEAELQQTIADMRIEAEIDSEEETEHQQGEQPTEPEVIVNHGYVEQDGIRSIKFKVKWKGFDKTKDQT